MCQSIDASVRSIDRLAGWLSGWLDRSVGTLQINQTNQTSKRTTTAFVRFMNPTQNNRPAMKKTTKRPYAEEEEEEEEEEHSGGGTATEMELEQEPEAATTTTSSLVPPAAEHAYPCNAPGCGLVFRSAQELEVHYTAAHRFSCEECRAQRGRGRGPSAFASSAILERHIEEHHDPFFQVRRYDMI
jgi:hypothetical protein